MGYSILVEGQDPLRHQSWSDGSGVFPIWIKATVQVGGQMEAEADHRQVLLGTAKAGQAEFEGVMNGMRVKAAKTRPVSQLRITVWLSPPELAGFAAMLLDMCQ